MGQHFSRRFHRWATRNDRRLLLVGLDGAGKTTVLYHLRTRANITTLPTIGFNMETIPYDEYKLHIWDVGGQDSLRPYWRHHFTGTQGIVFVVDSADSSRSELVKQELHGILKERQLQEIPLLLLVNKQDLPDAMTSEDLVESLELTQFWDTRQVHVQASVATTGKGVDDGVKWLCQHMIAL